MLTSVSTLKRLILPRTRSLIRGCVTPKSLAAWACVRFPPSRIRWSSIIRSARSLRFSASSGPNPRSRKTLPDDGRTLTELAAPPKTSPVLDERGEALTGLLEIRLAGLLTLLLERVEDIDSLLMFRNVDHTKCASD